MLQALTESISVVLRSRLPVLGFALQSQCHMAKAAEFCWLLGLEHGPFILIYQYQLSAFNVFLYYLSLDVL